MSEQYHETYRKIGFHLTDKGYWIFDDLPPAGRYRHWSSYLMPDEQKKFDKDTMRLAIDRYYLAITPPPP